MYSTGRLWVSSCKSSETKARIINRALHYKPRKLWNNTRNWSPNSAAVKPKRRAWSKNVKYSAPNKKHSELINNSVWWCNASTRTTSYQRRPFSRRLQRLRSPLRNTKLKRSKRKRRKVKTTKREMIPSLMEMMKTTMRSSKRLECRTE